MMYFNPYYLGLLVGILGGIALIFIILLIAAIVYANKENKDGR